MFGIDDGTGVVICVMWTNFLPDKDREELKEYLLKNEVQVGATLSVMGQLESYGGAVQVNVKNFKAVTNEDNELHQFNYSVVSNQKRLFDPFERPQEVAYFTNLARLEKIFEKDELITELESIHEEHREFIDQAMGKPDLYLEKDTQGEIGVLTKIASLSDPLCELVSNSRVEGPLPESSLKLGNPSLLSCLEKGSDYVSKQVKMYSQEAMIQKLANELLRKIGEILSEVSKGKTRGRRGDEDHDIYKMKLLADFVDNEIAKRTIEQFRQEKIELQELTYKNLVSKCISEFEKEGYIERRNASEDLEKEEVIHFIDKRSEFENFILRIISGQGTTGMQASEIFNKVNDFSRFYNHSYIKDTLNKLRVKGEIMEDNQTYYSHSAF